MERKPNYLHSLLAALDSDELARVRAVELPAKERALLDLCLTRISSQAPSKDEAEKLLNITGSHFDKINSLLLKKCYYALVPNGGGDLWLFLRRKNLIRHFYHDLALDERKLLRDGDPEALATFYYSGFENIHQLPFLSYDPQMARRYMERYFEITATVTPAERLMIEGRLVRQQIINGNAMGMQQKQKEKFYEDLIRLQALIPQVDKPEAIAQFYLAFALYYKSVSVDPKKNREHLHHAHAVILSHPQVFIEEDEVLLRCMIADTFYQESNFDEAYSQYQKVFTECEPLMKTQLFFCSSFVQLAVLTRHFTEAKDILDRIFGQYLNRGDNAQAATTAAISYAELALHSGNYDEGKKYIDIAFHHNDKNLLVAFEIKLRKLEAVFFALKGDYLFAESFIAKDLKYLQSRGYTLAKSPQGWFFKSLSAIIDERTNGKKLSAKLEAKYQDTLLGFSAIHGKLLEQFRQKSDTRPAQKVGQ